MTYLGVVVVCGRYDSAGRYDAAGRYVVVVVFHPLPESVVLCWSLLLRAGLFVCFCCTTGLMGLRMLGRSL